MVKNPKQSPFIILSVISDTLMTAVSFLLAYYIRFYIHKVPAEYIPAFHPYLKLLIIVIPIWLISLSYHGLYKQRNSFISPIDKVYLIFKAVLFATLVLMAITFLYRQFSYSRLTFGYASAFNFLCITLMSMAIRKIQIAAIKRGFGIRNVIIVGTDETAKAIAFKIQKHIALGYKIIGYISDKEITSSESKNNPEILGGISEIPEIAREKNIDKIIFASPNVSNKDTLDIILKCTELNVDFTIVPGLYEIVTSKVNVDDIDGIPVIGLKESPLQGFNLFLKRAFDLILSAILLIILSPLLLALLIAIKLNSKGPVLYKQERVGQDNQIFTMYKFRSMRMDAEEHTGPVWAQEKDPRRTKVGSFMRKMSFDELPQLLNIIRGNMSLIGPRPERPFFVEQFKNDILGYMSRHRIKPGITGWAQVNGLRGNTSIAERTKYDLYYIENWSIAFDLKILVRTILEFCFHKHAY
ncbi:MAG: undecaprenyl-phosphate glucose phosphotransferase [bacterium]|nr:undecaprenyl-phosphate glucose phosphotransferase [bacterium]